MKFSYSLLKKLAPKIPDKKTFIETFNLRVFESANLSGDAVEISIPANRYSDAASHWGIAKLAAAIFGGKAENFSAIKSARPRTKRSFYGAQPEIKGDYFDVVISVKNHCPRYMGRYFEIERVGNSPDWMRKCLTDCGLRPINAVVDILNYVMLEVGQPLHAFDFEKLAPSDKKGGKKKISVRLARSGEEIETIDNNRFKLKDSDLVIADEEGVLAIAGIKGGKRAEISSGVKKILVEAANFEPAGIYKTSRELSLATDASVRFAHGLSPVLAEIAMNRVSRLFQEILNAKSGAAKDAGKYKPAKKVLRFHIDRFNGLTGLQLKESVCLDYLKKLDFKVKGSFVEIPPTRMDIEIFEDLAEEIVNLYGYDNLPSQPPRVALRLSGYEDQIILKNNIRNALIGFGFSEVYNYSFLGDVDLRANTNANQRESEPLVEIENPISEDKKYLRPNLRPLLLKNMESNLRFYDEARIFEIGKIFLKDSSSKEKLMLGIAMAFKKGNPALELKGVIDQLLQAVGLVDYFMKPENENSLRLESDHQVLGYVNAVSDNRAVAEIDLEKLLALAEEEKSYEPLTKFPSVMRDISLFVPRASRIGEMLTTIENAASRLLQDVDMIDFYEAGVTDFADETRKSVTFRLVFLAKDRTLTDEEVEEEVKKITAALREEYGAEVR